MGLPFLLVENQANLRMFPANTLGADEEPTGFEVFHVADGRREVDDCWIPSTTNIQHQIDITNDTPRSVNALFLDRGHNLTGVAITLQYSDNGTTFVNVFTATIPTYAASSRSLTDANGCTTEEGAWGIRFTPTTTHPIYRLVIPAMGVGALPRVVGYFLGTGWEPPSFLTPWDEDADTLFVAELTSEWGWIGRGPATTRNENQIGIKLLTPSDYTLARLQLHTYFGAGRPMWICYDQAQADRSFLAVRPAGSRMSIGLEPGWFPRQTRFPYVELSPLRPS